MSDSERDQDGDRPFTIHTGSVIVNANGHKVIFNSGQLKTSDDGDLFTRVQTAKSSWRTLLTSLLARPADGTQHPHHHDYSRIKITRRLAKLKNDKIREYVGLKAKAKVVRVNRVKRYKEKQLTLPEVIEIVAPRVRDIPQMTMKVLSTRAGGKGYGLFIECTTTNLMYLAKVARFQIEEGGNGGGDCQGEDEGEDAPDARQDEDEPDAEQDEAEDQTEDEQEGEDSQEEDSAIDEQHKNHNMEEINYEHEVGAGVEKEKETEENLDVPDLEAIDVQQSRASSPNKPRQSVLDMLRKN